MLSEISQTNKDKTIYHLHLESKKYNKQVNITKKKQIHKYRELLVTNGEKEVERGNIGVGD